MDYKELNINLEGLTKEEALERVTGMIENAYSNDDVKKYEVIGRNYSVRDLIKFLHDTYAYETGAYGCIEVTHLKHSYANIDCNIGIGSKYVTREDINDILYKELSIDKEYLLCYPRIVVFNNAPQEYNLGHILSIYEHIEYSKDKDLVINANGVKPIPGIDRFYDSKIYVKNKYYTVYSLKEMVKESVEEATDAEIYNNSALIAYYMFRVEELSFEIITDDYLKSIKFNYGPVNHDTSSLIDNLVAIMQGTESEFNPMKYYNKFMSNKKYVELSNNMTIMDIIKKIYDYDPVDCVRQFYSNGIDIVDILERLGNE